LAFRKIIPYVSASTLAQSGRLGPLLHPDEHEEARKYWSNCLRTGEGDEHVYRVRNAQGDYRWFLTRAEPLRASDGILLLWIGRLWMLRSSSAPRKDCGRARRSSAATRNHSDWFWEIGPDYKFTLLTEKAFGSNAAGRIGATCWDHALDLKTEPEKWRLVWATLDSRKPFRDFVYRGLSGSGSPMYVKASGKPVFDANGEFRWLSRYRYRRDRIMRAQERCVKANEVHVQQLTG